MDFICTYGMYRFHGGNGWRWYGGVWMMDGFVGCMGYSYLNEKLHQWLGEGLGGGMG